MKITALLLACLALLSLPFAVTAREMVFKAGAATSNITPPLGMEIVGNFAPRPIANHVHDELHVRCLVLDDGTTKLAFAVADTISLGRDVWDEAKKKVEAATGIPVSNYWLHYVGGVSREDLSADYFGEFCLRIEEKVGAPCVGILANGPCGDVNNNDYSGKTPAVKREPYEKIKLVAGDLAQEVLRVRETLKHQDWLPLKAAASDLELAVRRPTPEMIAWAEGVLAKPKDATPKHHDLGGYETWLGTNRVEREASVKITTRALEMLEKVR
jgi:hypothetical protein